MREYGIVEEEDLEDHLVFRSVTRDVRQALQRKMAELTAKDPQLVIITPSLQIQTPIKDIPAATKVCSLYKAHADIKFTEFKRATLPPEAGANLSLDACKKLGLQMLLHEKNAFQLIERWSLNPACVAYKVTNTTYVCTQNGDLRIDKRTPYLEIPKFETEVAEQESKDDKRKSVECHVIWQPPKSRHANTRVIYINPATKSKLEFEVTTCRALFFKNKADCTVPIQFIPSASTVFSALHVHGDFVIQADSRHPPILFSRLSREAITAHPYQINLYQNNLLEDSLDLIAIPAISDLRGVFRYASEALAEKIKLAREAKAREDGKAKPVEKKAVLEVSTTTSFSPVVFFKKPGSEVTVSTNRIPAPGFSQ